MATTLRPQPSHHHCRNITPQLPLCYPLCHRPAVALPPPCGHRHCHVVFVTTIAVLLPLLPPPGERGMMVTMGHGLRVSFWVSGEMTKNKVGPKKCNATWSLSPHRPRALADSCKKNMAGKLFFVFASKRVPMYRRYILCTRECCNISLIEDQL